MDPRQAKLKTLEEIIGTMDEHMLGPVAAKAKSKAAPAVQPPMAPPAAAPEDALDADAAAQLRKLYEEEETADRPAIVAGGY